MSWSSQSSGRLLTSLEPLRSRFARMTDPAAANWMPVPSLFEK
jgi:hypothetical protein